MKKIRDFIYNFSDIFTTLLIVALAGTIIFWRVQVIMGYSEIVSPKPNDTQIDIDFSDVDLTPTPGDDVTAGEADDPDSKEEDDKPVLSFDENFRSPFQIMVNIQPGTSYSKAIRQVVTSYELQDDDFQYLYTYLYNTGINMGLETRIMIDNFKIPEGSSPVDIIKIITKTN